ncbi:helix-turn-helix domain-containing protein [Streptomyces sp. NPDC046909]|uniref:TetR/AcrR family transcriptional regulator n=1 Tax=Streptomyces sp. NPDC046909 TaxID=3155617 RepID=UPI0033D3C59D
MTSETGPRPPQQQRSRAAMERILQAAQTLIAERGTGELTIADVADRAGVSVGTIYSRFSGRDALITATQERWLEQVISSQQARYAEAAVESDSFEDFVTGRVTEMIAGFRSEADLIREFAVRATGPAGASGTARRMLQETFTRACDAILAHPDRSPQVSRIQISLALRAVQAVLEWRVTTKAADAPDNDWDLLAVELPRLALSYLREAPA